MTPAVVQAEAAVVLEQRVDPNQQTPTLEVLFLSGGSRWDPPGHEGRAWALGQSVHRPGVLEVEVSRDHMWWTLPCPAATGPKCDEVLAIALLNTSISPGILDEAQQELTLAQPDRAAVDVWYGLAYEAHPYGHPVVGRIGALQSAQGALQSWVAARAQVWSRPTIRARLTAATLSDAAPLASAITPILQRFPVGVVPDPAMKGPPTARAPTLAVVPVSGDRAYVLAGIAMPRRPTHTTRLLPTPADLDQRSLAIQCFQGTFSSSMELQSQRQAPPDWPASLSTPNHSEILWRSEGSPADMVARAAALLQDAVAPGQNTPGQGCEALPPEVASAMANLTVVLAWPQGEEIPALNVSPRVERLDLPSPSRGLFR